MFRVFTGLLLSFLGLAVVFAQPASVHAQVYAYTYRDQKITYNSVDDPPYVEVFQGPHTLMDVYTKLGVRTAGQFASSGSCGKQFRVEMWNAEFSDSFLWWNKTELIHSFTFQALGAGTNYACTEAFYTTPLPPGPVQPYPWSYFLRITTLDTVARTGAYQASVTSIPTNAREISHLRAATTNVAGIVYSSGFDQSPNDNVFNCCSTAVVAEWPNSYIYTVPIDSSGAIAATATPSPTATLAPTSTPGPGTPTAVPQPTVTPTPAPPAPGHSWVDNLPSVANPLGTMAANIASLPQSVASAVETSVGVPGVGYSETKTAGYQAAVDAKFEPIRESQTALTTVVDGMYQVDCDSFGGFTVTLPAFSGSWSLTLFSGPFMASFYCPVVRPLIALVVDVSVVFFVMFTTMAMFRRLG